MSKLSIKTVERLKLPYGRFGFEILLCRSYCSAYQSASNAKQIEAMRVMLRETCGDRFKLIHEVNYEKKRVYTKLLLTNAMDVAILKLVHADKMHRIYKIKIVERCELPSENGRIAA